MAEEISASNDMSHTNSSSQEQSSSATKSYDLSQVLKVSRGDVGFVKSVVRMFLAKTPLYIDRIVKEFEAGNYHEMGEAAHQLKQSVYAMGINSLRIPIMAIILVGRSNKPDKDLADQIEKLKHFADLVIQDLRHDFEI